MLPTLSLLTAPQVAVMETCSVVIDPNVGIMATFGFQSAHMTGGGMLSGGIKRHPKKI